MVWRERSNKINQIADSLPVSNQTLLWAIYNDGKLFKKFEEIEMDDETKEDFRNAIQEFQSAIQDINFWKNFFKNIDHFSD